LFHLVADGRVRKGDSQRDELTMSEAGRWRFPIAFGNEELHGLEALLALAT
jgi:hypothetical protein